MSNTTTYRTSTSLPAELPAEATEAEGLDPFSWAMIQALKKCQDPKNSRIFLPNLLAKGPVQPYKTDEWDFSNLGSSVDGSDSICSGTKGSGKHNPDKDIHLKLTNVDVNGLANAKPTDWDVHQIKGGAENYAKINIAFCAFDEDVLPKGVDSNLVIKANFDIRQPCMGVKDNTDKYWTAEGLGNITVTIEKATGMAEMTIYTTGNGDDMQLHANVSTIQFQIGGLTCNDQDAGSDSDRQIKIDVDVTNITGTDKLVWHDYINRVVNQKMALCKLQEQINSVLDAKDAKEHLASVAIKQIEDILNG